MSVSIKGQGVLLFVPVHAMVLHPPCLIHYIMMGYEFQVLVHSTCMYVRGSILELGAPSTFSEKSDRVPNMLASSHYISHVQKNYDRQRKKLYGINIIGLPVYTYRTVRKWK